jgi:ABC-type branched-subunit amino acid transport system permease subunit
MMLAQAIGEYGGVAGAVSGAFTRAYNGVQSFLYDAEPSTWMIVAAVVVVVWLLRPRGR